MFEGTPRAQKQEITLPTGEKIEVNGIIKGTIDRPTIIGTDTEGHNVEVVYDTIDGNLTVISYTIDGEEKLEHPPLAA